MVVCHWSYRMAKWIYAVCSIPTQAGAAAIVRSFAAGIANQPEPTHAQLYQ